MPLNGGVVLPQNVHVQPFTSEVILNASLDTRVLGAPLGSNGPPRGHTDLNGRHPGLGDHLQGGIMLSKMLPTSLSPKMVNYEATKNIKWLPGVSETAGVVCKEAGWVLLALPGSLAQKDEGPIDHHVMGRLPFDPYSLEGVPSKLRHWALQEAMLGGLFRIAVTHFAVRSDAHKLKPSAHWEALV
ncbi:unnamed protein product [Sphagnum jensenii]|uniref:Chlorophyll a-b binding protein, chloroplastic n=1 Tax=Sphagnum jensenii TaxID=128206 RepID=A0ABP0XD25_9BRYO